MTKLARSVLSAVCGVVLATMVSSPASAQEGGEAPPDEGRRKKGWMPRWFGGGGREGERPDAARDAAERQRAKKLQRARGMKGAGQKPPAPVQMSLAAGKLYVILGDKISRLDADTLTEEASARIPRAIPPELKKREERVRSAFLARFDRNADGAITRDELDRPEILTKLDKDGDGKITAAEVPTPRNLVPPAGPATMLVEGGRVFVFRDGQLFRFDAETLELKAKAELAPPPQVHPHRPGGHGRPFGGQRPGGKGDRRREKRRKVPPADLPPPPDEEPVRF
jgi:hypothetical protein